MRSCLEILATRLDRARAQLALAFLLTLASGSVVAAVFNVAAGDTAGLIAAITTANGNGVPNVINLAGGTYSLATVDNTSVLAGPNGLPAIINTLTMNGNGATIARTGVPLFRVLQVGSATGTAGALTLNNVIITGGNPGQIFSGPQAATDGGGIMVTVNAFGSLPTVPSWFTTITS